ncbi:peptidoglycan-binding protein [Streptomyces sp. Qhu-G9]|uniref:peptidoglycan-binding protein n=1 Tax=Streptomyces sp. Qhu-G9 TaxID=3452799 RepID=UPI0022AC5589|nr:peptidoglycan-binding protein [Streptomyces aurantiacus]WAU79283.1 peptidoglycan-binding protein [Streptomyces aurantiacus]
MRDSQESSGLSRRKRAVAALAAGAVVLAGAAVWTSTFVKSPAQAAADAGPPARDVLTAPVERRVLSDTVVTRGAVSASQTVDIAPVGAALADSATPVVTKVMVRSGQTFKAGRVLVEISGRPVFALPGKLPVYRDLKPGTHGNDVRQLQEALRTLGHSTGTDTPGTFGPGTKQAVAALYAAIGYEAVAAGGTGEGGDGDPVSAARDQVKQAQRQLDGLLKAASGESGKTDEEGKAGETGADAIRYAREDLAEARARLTEAEEVSGPMVPASEVVFLSGFPARVDVMAARIGGEVGEKLATVSAGRLVIKGSLGAQEKDLVQPGQQVKVLSEVYGDEVTGKVSSVASAPAAPEGDDKETTTTAGGQGYAVVVKSDSALPARLAGQDVRLTIEAASSGKKVLVVPVSALSAGADSRTTVTVLDRSGERRRIEVRPGTAGDGYTEVTPVKGARLAEGDKVVVGVSR